MKSSDYVPVLNENLMPFVEAPKYLPLEYYHNNASILAAKPNPRFRLTDLFSRLKSDEKHMGYTVRQIYAGHKQYASVDQLKVAIPETWRGLDWETF